MPTRPVTPFKFKSKFFPPGQFHSIDIFIRIIKHDEFTALRTLKEDKSIIIKPADKSSAIVVMDYVDYKEGMTAMFIDTASYVVLKKNPVQVLKMH